MFSPAVLRKVRTSGSRRLIRATQVVTLTGAVLAGGSNAVRAEGTGEYVGTLNVSGTRFGPEVTYQATIQARLPVSDRDADSLTAEFLAGEAPNATATIIQWDMSHTESSPDADGQYSSWKCSLAGPTAVQMTPSGSLYLNLGAQEYSLSMTLLSTDEVDFNCEHSRSGPFKKKEGVLLYAGTNIPGPPTFQKMSDLAHLATTYTLVPPAEMAAEYGPIVQTWDLRLTP